MSTQRLKQFNTNTLETDAKQTEAVAPLMRLMKTVIQSGGLSISWTNPMTIQLILHCAMIMLCSGFMRTALLKFPLYYHALCLFALHYNSLKWAAVTGWFRAARE